ncbi:MAG TPA: hypothetical protein VJT33_02280 [bacterium]|nr:hypothetical protein [bacterium]
MGRCGTIREERSVIVARPDGRGGWLFAGGYDRRAGDRYVGAGEVVGQRREPI